MTTSNRLFENISTIYMATAQSPIFGYCTSHNYFPTAYLSIICLLQIHQLFNHCNSSKYLVTVHRKIVRKLQIAYLEIFRRFTWLLRKAHILATAQHTIIFLMRFFQLSVYCISTNYFTTLNRPYISLQRIEKMYGNFKSPIWKYFDDLYDDCTKPNF